MIYLEITKKLSSVDVNFIEIFCNNVSIAFENMQVSLLWQTYSMPYELKGFIKKHGPLKKL
jgi:hypothetical protein